MLNFRVSIMIAVTPPANTHTFTIATTANALFAENHGAKAYDQPEHRSVTALPFLWLSRPLRWPYPVLLNGYM
jgi:hypothetical protein